MDRLDQLESQSIFIFREAFNRIENIALLWSLGKDSNVMIWLARKAFFGHVPFPVMHVDTEKKFPEMYEFRDRYAAEWNLNFIRELCPSIEEIDDTLPPAARSAARKTAGLKKAIEKHKFNALFAGIRRDEEATRAKERVFSPRGATGQWDFKDQPPEFWDQFKNSGGNAYPCASFAALDRDRHLALHAAGADTDDPALLRPGRQALPFARRQGHHLTGREHSHDY
jgi:sulfate adenylyltransferase subunit 2